MSRLKYYKQEETKFKDAFNTALLPELARKIFRKLKKKYKLEQELCVSKNVKGRKINGNCVEGCCCECHIQIGIPSTIGTLAHEVAHAIQYKCKPRRKWHDNNHSLLMKEIIDYINTSK